MARVSNGWLALLLRCALTAGAVLLGIALVRVGLADVILRATRDGLRDADSMPPAMLERAQVPLRRALTLDPRNPLLLETLGDMVYRQARFAAHDLSAKRDALEKARDYYLAAIAVRPNLGERWADLITVSSALISVKQTLAATPQQATRDIAEDLRRLKQAMKYGARLAPWRSDVLYPIDKAGTLHAALLGPREFAIVDGARARIAEKNHQPP